MTGHSAPSGRPTLEETAEQRIERFSRQLVLQGVGAAGQTRWLSARVDVSGADLAARAARVWLSAAGVGDGGTPVAPRGSPDGLSALTSGVETARATLLELLAGRGPSPGTAGEPRSSDLAGKRVLVVGAGGLGCPALLGLAAVGASVVRLVDDDLVERSNLPRQVLHRLEDLGRSKVESAAEGLRRWGFDSMAIEPVRARFDVGSAARLLDGMDAVLDASDNFPTKYRVNAAARASGVPAVIGGALRMDGQVFRSEPGGPCYRCVFARSPEPGAAPTCSSVGILGPVVGLVGLRQVAAQPSALDAFDGRTGRWTTFSVPRRDDCPACGPEPDEPWMRS